MHHTALYFSPTGGVRRACALLAAAIAPDFTHVDLSLTLSGQHIPAFGAQDVCLIAVPSFGGRVPEIAAARLAHVQGGGARAILLSVYGNRSDEDTLYELRDIAEASGFVPVAAVRAIAQHSIVPDIAAGRPDTQDARHIADFGAQIAALLDSGSREPVALARKPLLRPYGGVPLHPKANKRCTGCGKCATLCPAHAIPSDDPAMTLAADCITCMRCVSVCPEHARRLPPLVLALAGRKLKRVCTVRREPELILPHHA